MDVIRIFVGCSANGEDAEAQAMLEYSIRSRTHRDVEIVWMKLSRDQNSPWYSAPLREEGWNTRTWATPFSAFRWAIPSVCDYHGKAIYMDVDQVVMADIGELWDQPIPEGKALLAKKAGVYCVILWDCAAARNLLPDFETLRRTMGLYRQQAKGRHIHNATALFKGNWNCHDGERYKNLDDPDIKLIHFTEVSTQPHLKWALPRLKAAGQRHWNNCAARNHPHRGVQPLVDRLWEEAQAAGYTADRYIPVESFGSYDAVRGGPPARAA